MNVRMLIRSSAVVTFLALSTSIWAQQKFPIVITSESQTSKYIQQHKIDVGDVPGHQVRIQETHRTYGDKSTFEFGGVRVEESWVRGFSDYTNGKGRAWGYGEWILEDGGKVFFDYSGQSHSEPTSTGSLEGSYHGTTRITGGMGRYKGIRGTISDALTFNNDPKTGYNRTDGKGEYWFEE